MSYGAPHEASILVLKAMTPPLHDTFLLIKYKENKQHFLTKTIKHITSLRSIRENNIYKVAKCLLVLKKPDKICLNNKHQHWCMCDQMCIKVTIMGWRNIITRCDFAASCPSVEENRTSMHHALCCVTSHESCNALQRTVATSPISNHANRIHHMITQAPVDC